MKDSQVAAQELKYSSQFDRQVDFDNRVIRINGEIDDEEFNRIDAAMTIMEKDNNKQITVRINSYGGEIYSALAIVGRLKKNKGIQVVTEGYGKIMSAATLILACGDKRKISRFSWLMHHESNYSLDDDRHSNHKHFLRQMEKEDDKWCEFMEQFTNKDKNFWKKVGVGKDRYFDPDELLDIGVVDEIF